MSETVRGLRVTPRICRPARPCPLRDNIDSTMGLALLFPPSLGRITASARAEMLGEWVAQVLDRPVEVAIARDYAELQQAIRDAAFELVWAPPAICAQVVHDVRAVFQAVRSGNSQYRAAVVARRGDVRSMEELAGRRAAWVDRLSAAGYLLVAAELQRRGLSLQQDLAHQAFYGSYAIALRAVLGDKADFASIYVHEPDEASARASLREVVGDVHKQLSVVGFTQPAPTDALVVTRHEQAEATIAAVEQLIAAASADDESPLLSVLDAESLVRARPEDYAALRLDDPA